MRIKMKISYHASMKKISVLEHFILGMIMAYQDLHFVDNDSKDILNTGRALLSRECQGFESYMESTDRFGDEDE